MARKVAATEPYLYHETRKDALPYIREEGILPTSYGQSLVGDMGEVMSPDMLEEDELELIPEEDLIPRTYVQLKEPSSLYYGDVLLRFPKDSAGPLKKDVDYYVLKEIPPHLVEVKMGGKWIPIKAERIMSSASEIYKA